LLTVPTLGLIFPPWPFFLVPFSSPDVSSGPYPFPSLFQSFFSPGSVRPWCPPVRNFALDIVLFCAFSQPFSDGFGFITPHRSWGPFVGAVSVTDRSVCPRSKCPLHPLMLFFCPPKPFVLLILPVPPNTGAFFLDVFFPEFLTFSPLQCRVISSTSGALPRFGVGFAFLITPRHQSPTFGVAPCGAGFSRPNPLFPLNKGLLSVSQFRPMPHWFFCGSVADLIFHTARLPRFDVVVFKGSPHFALSYSPVMLTFF